MIRVLILSAVLLVCMGISFVLVSGNSSFSATNAVGTVVAPVQGFFSEIGSRIGGFFEFIGDMRGYQEENLILREKSEQQEQKLREMESYQQENQRLRQLLELKESRADWDMVGCEVIAKDPGNWFDAFTIDKGKNHNIQKNDVVITSKGLVGRITEVGANWARVVAIIDTDSSVGALLTRTQDIAIADGDLALSDSGQCRLNSVTNGSSMAIGDEVETSGLGGIYPKGILIGTVREIETDQNGYSQVAILDTAVDFERIREVMVIRMPRENSEE